MNDRDFFLEKGYLLKRNLFSEEEIKALVWEKDRLLNSEIVHPQNIRTIFDVSNQKVERVDPLIDISDSFESLSRDSRIHKILAELFESYDNTLYKEKLIFKLPWNSGYPTHQDYAWWEHIFDNPNDILTVAIPLDNNDDVNQGLLELYPENHFKLYREQSNMLPEDYINFCCWSQLMYMNKWDVLFFHSLIPHKSSSNITNKSRSMLYFTYVKWVLDNIRKEYYDYYLKREQSNIWMPNLYFK